MLGPNLAAVEQARLFLGEDKYPPLPSVNLSNTRTLSQATIGGAELLTAAGQGPEASGRRVCRSSMGLAVESHLRGAV